MTDRTDNFNRTNSTTALGTPSDGGSDWGTSGGTWGISSNQGYRVDAGTYAFAFLECDTADGEVQVTLSATDNPYMGPTCRTTSDQNWVGVIASDALNQVLLYKRVSGSYTQLGSTYSGAVAAGDVFKIVFSGSSYTVYQNGVSRITATDSSHNTITKHGITSNNGTAGGGRFEDWSFTGAAAATYVRPKMTVRSQSAHRASRR